jgi:hypothetical protein
MTAVQQQAALDSEPYLDAAVSRWLPKAAVNSAPDLEAAKLLADLLVKQHGDPWLNDALNEMAPDVRPAWLLLEKGFADVRRGRASSAASEAREAQNIFERGNATAGAVRASLEVLFALQRSAQWRSCESEAARLAPFIAAHSYFWAAAQAYLEWSSCAQNLADLPTARSAAVRAADIAAVHRYSVLELRVLGLNAYIDSTIGNYAGAWKTDYDGLVRCFQSPCSDARAFQFYSDLSGVAESLGYSSMAAAYQRETLKFVVRIRNAAMEAMAHYRMGSLLVQSDKIRAAEEFSRASSLFQSVADQPEMEALRAGSEVELASIALETGDIGTARDVLKQVEAKVFQIDDTMLRFQFYRTLAQIAMRERHWEDAEKSLSWITETGFRSVRKLSPSPQRDAWLHAVGDATLSLAGLRFERSRDISEAVRLVSWQSQFRLHPQQVSGLAEYRLPSLPTGTVEVGWLPVDRHWIVWIRNAERIQYAETREETGALTGAIADFRKLCSDRRSDIELLRKAGRSLYERLMGGLTLPDRSSIVLLLPEPFEALPAAALVQSDGKYLGERHSVWVESGSPHPHGNIDFRAASALAVSAPTAGADFNEWLPDLPEADHEAADVADRFSRSVSLTGAQTTSEALLKALRTANVFHYAGHSYSTASSAGLLLSPSSNHNKPSSPSLLTSDQLRQINMSMFRLVVLSACGTGVNTTSQNISLARVFLESGTEWVVATDWNLESAASAAFMHAFYDSLALSGSVPESTQRAAAVVRTNLRTAHPYYWAVFIPYGPPTQ